MKSQVNGEKNDLNALFRIACENLPYSKYKVVREELMEVLHWSYPTFYTRLRGERKIKPLEIPHIEEVFSKHGVLVFKQ